MFSYIDNTKVSTRENLIFERYRKVEARKMTPKGPPGACDFNYGF